MGADLAAAALLRSAPWGARLGLAVILLYALAALAAPLIAPYSERDVVGPEFSAWSAAHPLGTDNLGRDMVSRLIWGGHNTILIAFTTTCIAFVAGGGLGLVSGTLGGRLDALLAWAVDVAMSVPSLIVAMLMLTIFGTSVPVLMAVIATIEATRVFRVARSVALGVAAADFMDAARLRGEGLLWLVGREALPNVAAPLVAEFGLRFTYVILFVSALSFLGIGIQPPTADWGSMVRDNATLITYGDITPLLPAIAIAVLTVSVNLVVDWVLHLSSGLRS